MEERFLQQLKKGVLELLVLQTICRGPTYGYELIAQLGSRSGGLFTLREGTLYPILYRLEDDGLIEAVWQQETGYSPGRHPIKRLHDLRIGCLNLIATAF